LILVIDLNIDIWPAIALAYETPESDIMRRKPRDAKHDKLVNARLIGWSYPLVCENPCPSKSFGMDYLIIVSQVGMIQAAACMFAFLCVFGEGKNQDGFPAGD